MSELRSDIRRQLETGNIDNTKFEADQITFEASGYSASDFHEVENQPVTNNAVAKVDAMVKRRLGGEPLQYVLGSWSFRKLDLMVDKRVLIPRPETEEVVGWAIDATADVSSPKVLDLGCGSGAIGLSFVAEIPGAQVVMSDASAEAIQVARANLTGLGMAGPNTEIRHGSWFEVLGESEIGSFDLIISNPPYVAEGDDLDASVNDWEPASALIATDSGTADIRQIIAGASKWLKPGGVLVIEMAPGQTDEMASLACGSFSSVEIKTDLARHARAIVCR